MLLARRCSNSVQQLKTPSSSDTLSDTVIQTLTGSPPLNSPCSTRPSGSRTRMTACVAFLAFTPPPAASFARVSRVISICRPSSAAAVGEHSCKKQV
jgi:hypothetical protein